MKGFNAIYKTKHVIISLNFVRYYDGDQNELFADAHIVNPHREPTSSRIIIVCQCGLYNF